MSAPASPITCDLKDITPEDFLRKVIRSNGSGGYALAIKDVGPAGPWTEAAACQDGITWRDIVMLIAGQTADGKFAIDTVQVT